MGGEIIQNTRKTKHRNTIWTTTQATAIETRIEMKINKKRG